MLKRSVNRAKINDSDRVFWVLMRRMLKDWRDSLVIVKPQTVVRWHRQGFRYYWRWKSRAKPGRPPIAMKIVFLIKRLSRENPLWGSPHISNELALLGQPHLGDGSLRLLCRVNADLQAALLLCGPRP